MKLLLDTQLLLWAAGQPKRLSRAARVLLSDPDNELIYSAASLPLCQDSCRITAGVIASG
jgi:PIN domain nuclease of toxin-antitoxin system